MYQGKVNVEQEELDSFLATAQELKIKGLTPLRTQLPLVNDKPSLPDKVSAGLDDGQEVFMSGDSAMVQSNVAKEVNEKGPEHLKHFKAEILVEEPNFGVETFGDHEGANDSSMVDMEGNQGEPLFFNPFINNSVHCPGLADLDSLIEEHMTKVKDHSQGRLVWSCNDCGKFSRLKNDIAQHVEAVHITHPGLVCDICEKVLKTRSTLKSHMKSKHRDAQRLDK